MADSGRQITANRTASSSPDRQRPPLPPRPSELNLLQTRQPSGPSGRPDARGGLMGSATTALSMTDINTITKADGTKELRATPVPSRAPSTGSIFRFGSTRRTENSEDNSSIRSYIPNNRSGNDVESIFEGALDDGNNRRSSSRSGASLSDESMVELEHEADVDFDTEFEDVDEEALQEEQAQLLWQTKKKHFLILSAAGKPIYARHGSDSIISSYIGIIQTIISSYQSSDDPLKSFQATGIKFVILSQTNLFLVAISRLAESENQLRVQLEALYMQILSTLTLPTLTHIFSVRPSSDLRRPLQGTEVLLSSLADSFTRGSPSTLLSALECLKIRKSHRMVINNTLIKTRVDELLYGLIVAGGRLVSVIRPKKHSLHPSDLQLIFNMLFEAEGIKAGGGESWIPICLPGFNNKGYLYMYVSFLDMRGESVREVNDDERIEKDDAVAIILLSAGKESFESLRNMKIQLVQEFQRNRSMYIIQKAVQAGRLLPTDILPGTVLRHFLYKSRGNVQFFMPSLTPQFESINKHRQLMSLYHNLHASVHTKYASVKVHHSISPSAAALAWVTPMFELYCIAPPTTARNALAQNANKVVQWIQREEERIFIIGGAVF